MNIYQLWDDTCYISRTTHANDLQAFLFVMIFDHVYGKTIKKLQFLPQEFPFKGADTEAMAQALANTDWEAVLGGEADIESANENFAKAIVEAAKIANVPTFIRPSVDSMSKKVKDLTQEKSKLEQQLTKDFIRNKDKETKKKNVLKQSTLKFSKL